MKRSVYAFTLVFLALSMAVPLVVSQSAAKAAAEPMERPVFVVRSGNQTWKEAEDSARAQGAPHPGARIYATGPLISDSNSWPVIGSKSPDKSYWQNLKLVVEGAYCSKATNAIVSLALTRE